MISRLVPITALLAAPLVAHDMWIEPQTFFPAAGDVVGVKLRVGQDLLGDPLPRNSSLFSQFFADDGAGRKPLIGREGANPAGFLRVAGPGLLVIGYRGNPSPVDLEAGKFNQYLKEEGLDSILALRAKRNQSGAQAHELFARCAKSLVHAGGAENQGDRSLGFTLELVAEKNPYATPAGGQIPFRLTYENKPLAGALVIALNRLDPAGKLSARTGKDGRVSFALKPSGMWLVKSVHMVPAPAGSNADWLSYWASLTFEAGAKERK